MSRPNPLKYVYVAVAIYLLTPLALVVAMSFKDAPFMGFPIQKLTLRWYAEILADREFLAALGLSIWIALTSTAIALVLALWVSLALVRLATWAQTLLFALVSLPLVVPSVVSAISFRVFFQAIDIPQGTTAIVLAHASYGTPFLVLMILTRLRAMPSNLVDAALDLGADHFVAFLRVTLPYLSPALIGGSIFAVLSSFDDFIRAFFLGAYEPTLPVLVYSRLFEGISPALAAISTVVLTTTVVLGIYAERLVTRFK